uniref:Putative longitudinals lacking protein isoform h/m/v n=1 Tax=Xenopsylla cheopis TaxID=163159 RepID=A0A6M2DU89_XENCH
MEDDQQFCLKWNNHQSTLISQFDTLLENETLVDCTLAAEGKYLRAHKVVLSACSPYFESLLRLQYDKHPIFILKDVKYQELRAMIDYMYRGQVNISQDQLGALLKAAETLQIKGLSDSRTNEKKQPERVPSPPLPSSTKSSGPTISKPIVKPPPPDDDIADQSSPADRETSSSPTSRKRRRSRRHSNDESAVLPDNHELSNSSTHSEFVSHLSAQSSINRPSITDRTENSTDTFQSPAIAKTTEKLNVPKVKEIRKSEQHSELILEPKSEYVDEEGNDSVEDLTLEDEDMDDMDQSQAGPSHGGEGSSQGFAGWHNMGGDRTQDEVFMAAQDAAAGHRDSQVAKRRRVLELPILHPLNLGLNTNLENDLINTLSKLSKKIDKLTNDMQHCQRPNWAQPNADSISNETFNKVRTVYNNLPVQTLEELERLEEELFNADFRKYLKNRLACIGGANSKSATVALLRKVFLDAVAKEFSWVAGKKKRNFSALKVTALIIEVVSDSCNYNVTEYEVSDHIRNWLRHACDRYIRLTQ